MYGLHIYFSSCLKFHFFLFRYRFIYTVYSLTRIQKPTQLQKFEVTIIEYNSFIWHSDKILSSVVIRFHFDIWHIETQ